MSWSAVAAVMRGETVGVDNDLRRERAGVEAVICCCSSGGLSMCWLMLIREDDRSSSAWLSEFC